jgi:hypothetical protein
LERWNRDEIQRTGWGSGSAALGEYFPRIGFDFCWLKLQIAMGGCESLRRKKEHEMGQKGTILGHWRDEGRRYGCGLTAWKENRKPRDPRSNRPRARLDTPPGTERSKDRDNISSHFSI